MSFNIRIAQSAADREACFRIRTGVFVEEQNVPLEIEMDDLDAVATHFLMTTDGGLPVGTARLFDKSGVAKIGRVAIVREFRGAGLGKLLMETVLAEARKQGFREAALDSQCYAIPFYERVGFVAEGGEFDDAGIPHRHMRMAL